MKKITRNIATLMLLTIAGTTVATAQVAEQKIGDNNLIMNQNAVLDIESTNKGLLLPRLELKATDNFEPLAAHVEGMTVYNTAASDATVADENKVTPGYYYNDGTQWVRIATATGADIKTEPWRVQNTTDEATANTENIYQQGKVAVGFTSADPVSGKQLEVKGSFKAGEVIGDKQFGIETHAFGGEATRIYHRDNTLVPSKFADFTLRSSTVAASVGTGIFPTSQMLLNDGKINLEVGNLGTYVDMTRFEMENDMIRLSAIPNGMATDEDTFIEVPINEGVKFRYGFPGTSLSQGYEFPRNAGTANQVLVTNGLVPATRMAQLEWKNISDLNTNLYNTNGTLTSNRTVTLDGKFLRFVGSQKTFTLSASDGGGPSISSSGTADLGFRGGGNTNLDIQAFNTGNITISASGGAKSLRIGTNYTTGTSAPIIFSTSSAGGAGVERMRITGEGNVGIATNSPSQMLDIGTGNVRIRDINDNEGTATDKIVVADTDGVLKTLKAAMPKFFYMPSIIIPTSEAQMADPVYGGLTGDSFDDGALEGTINLYARYNAQFGTTGTAAQPSSPGAPALPVLPASELHYYITWYDTTVFSSVAVDANGVMTYELLPTADITIGSFMNIVFAVKED